MRISARADYAVRAAVALARSDERRSADSIARGEGIPSKFLEGILTALRHAGVAESRRGSAGGYRLARAASEITIADVIRAVDGPLVFVRDTRPSHMSDDGALLRVWVALRANVRAVLEGTTLEQVAIDDLPETVRELVADPAAWSNPDER